jgi:hypothetical protein
MVDGTKRNNERIFQAIAALGGVATLATMFLASRSPATNSLLAAASLFLLCLGSAKIVWTSRFAKALRLAGVAGIVGIGVLLWTFTAPAPEPPFSENRTQPKAGSDSTKAPYSVKLMVIVTGARDGTFVWWVAGGHRSPVTAFLFVRITNLQTIRTRIERVTAKIRPRSSITWTPLRTIAGSGQFYLAGEELKRATQIAPPTPMLDTTHRLLDCVHQISFRAPLFFSSR